MNINIKSGTRSDARPLCNTCRWAVVIKGSAESQELIRCSVIEQMIPFPENGGLPANVGTAAP